MSVLLDVRNVTMHFGGVHALTDVSFQVKDGEFLSLIGPNGAGKTTLLRSIIGTLKPQEAQISLKGKDISGLPTHRRAGLGLALTNQIVRPFRSMSLLEASFPVAGMVQRPTSDLVERFPGVIPASKGQQILGE